MSGLSAFTLFHTALSLVQLVSGIILVIALVGSRNGGPSVSGPMVRRRGGEISH